MIGEGESSCKREKKRKSCRISCHSLGKEERERKVASCLLKIGGLTFGVKEREAD